MAPGLTARGTGRLAGPLSRGAGLAATTDAQAVAARLALHESALAVRAYRRAAEQLMLWAVVDRRLPLSSLTTEDAIAYRAFLPRPVLAARWTGPPCPRT